MSNLQDTSGRSIDDPAAVIGVLLLWGVFDAVIGEVCLVANSPWVSDVINGFRFPIGIKVNTRPVDI